VENGELFKLECKGCGQATAFHQTQEQAVLYWNSVKEHANDKPKVATTEQTDKLTEKLFCLALIQESTDVVMRVTSRFNEYKNNPTPQITALLHGGK
jgi:hypothetical protein